ncbi:hypothetical protein [Chamaesiphon sp. OTE_8_metabat_110]|uniref:hypothetical protein n=1 Tax=Chamaesiphon sp. OTE_8_metabat_110 TaxID=2964696 RepID=UPI00286CD6CE|nr:hypothetical protein [Chamaesiphon sp. OTE_8_metabat_110]
MTQTHAEVPSARFGSLPSLGAAFLCLGFPPNKKATQLPSGRLRQRTGGNLPFVCVSDARSGGSLQVERVKTRQRQDRGEPEPKDLAGLKSKSYLDSATPNYQLSIIN